MPKEPTAVEIADFAAGLHDRDAELCGEGVSADDPARAGGIFLMSLCALANEALDRRPIVRKAGPRGR